MTTGLLEKPAISTAMQECCEAEMNAIPCEDSREELCKKLCLNILEGLLEGYENLKQKNPKETECIESKIYQLKSEINKQRVLV